MGEGFNITGPFGQYGKIEQREVQPLPPNQQRDFVSECNHLLAAKDATISTLRAELEEARERIAQLEGERRTLICMAVDTEQLSYTPPEPSEDYPGGFIYYNSGEPLKAEEPWGNGAQYLRAEASFLARGAEGVG